MTPPGVSVERVPTASCGLVALVVDITGTTPYYDAPLSRALAGYPEVQFRTCPFFTDPDAFPDSGLKRDLLPTAAKLVQRWPGLVHRPLLWKFVQLHGYLSGCRDVMREVTRERIPVVHFQWCKLPLLDVWPMRRLQSQGVQVVYTIHDALPRGGRNVLVRRAYRNLYRQADVLIVLSRFVGQQVADWVDASLAPKTYIIEHGLLDLADPSPGREAARVELRLDRDAEVVLFMGRISAYKGISDLIDAVALARGARPKLRLIIAGSPQESFDPYQARIRHLGLDGIVQSYPRYVSDKFKTSLYAAADLAVLPHRDPSQSAMGLEALAAGKPIIATRRGGLVEMVDEEINGYLVPVGEPASIANALDRFFSLPRPHQAAMAAASRTLGAQRFGWSAIARKHIDLYRQLARQERGNAPR